MNLSQVQGVVLKRLPWMPIIDNIGQVVHVGQSSGVCGLTGGGWAVDDDGVHGLVLLGEDVLVAGLTLLADSEVSPPPACSETCQEPDQRRNTSG